MKRLSDVETMSELPLFPSLYQINTRVWLTELSRALGRPATLDDIPDAELDRAGRDGVRLDLAPERVADRAGRAAGVAHQSRVAHESSRRRCRTCARRTSPAPGFAITGYTVHPDLGGDAALARLRERLRARGLRLMLDFVPNHTGLDHPWVEDHPEYYIAGTEADLARAPQNYTWVKRDAGRPAAGLRPRSVLRRLAGHAAARLRQSGHSGGDDRASC